MTLLINVATNFGDQGYQRSALNWLTDRMNDQKLHGSLGWEFARAYRDNEDGSTINLVNVMRYYENIPHQYKALNMLESRLDRGILKAFEDQYYADISLPLSVNLDLPWFPQTDSSVSGQSDRMCFSSSVSMCASYQSSVFRSRFTGYNADDQYLKFLHNGYGDTTNPQAHVAALRSLGLNAIFRQDLNLIEAISLLQQNIPIAIGFLHRGSHDAPSGGGHYAALKGFQQNQNMFYLNDPYGSLHDSYKGSVNNGKNVQYSRAILNNRWTVDNLGIDSKCGWGLYILP